MVSVEDDDLAGLEDVSSEGEDDNYEAEQSDSETTSVGPTSGRRPYRKKSRVDSMDPLPLMEGEGKFLRVRGFNQSQRAAFVQILMRFGVGEYDWAEFIPRLKQKTYEEIKEYGMLFLSHLVEEVNDSPTFSDGVPKEGLRVQDVLVRVGQLELIADKVKLLSQNLDAPLFTDDILSFYPVLKGGRHWKRQHDALLLRAVIKHGYGRWQAIIDDKELKIQEVITQELNLPPLNLPGSGGDAAQGTDNGGSFLYQFREMQRRQVEFIKKRVLLLEKGLFAEYYKDFQVKQIKVPVKQPGTVAQGEGAPPSNASSKDTVVEVMSQFPRLEQIAKEEVAANGQDDNPDRLGLAQAYNQMCHVMEQNAHDAAQACMGNQSSINLGKKILPQLEEVHSKVTQILSSSLSPVNPNVEAGKEMDLNAASGQDQKTDPSTPIHASSENGGGDVDMKEADAAADQTVKAEEVAKPGVVVLDD